LNLEKSKIDNGMAGFSVIFFLCTLVAKLTGIINLHWFWVITSIWWGPIVAMFGATVLYFLVFGIAFFFAFFFKSRRDK